MYHFGFNGHDKELYLLRTAGVFWSLPVSWGTQSHLYSCKMEPVLSDWTSKL